MSQMSSEAGLAERLAEEFFRRVWAPPHDLQAIDELMTEDYRITSAGRVIEGRDAFKAWVAEMQRHVTGATNEHLDLFADSTGEKVVSRWITRGRNNGMFGLLPDDKAIEFTGIAIWKVRDGRLAECWVERSAFELHLRSTNARLRDVATSMANAARNLSAPALPPSTAAADHDSHRNGK